MRPSQLLYTQSDHTLVARSQALAQGLRTFRPSQELPSALWETAYLLQEGANADRSLSERLRILGLMTTSLDQFFAEVLPLWQQDAAHDSAIAQRLQTLPAQVKAMLQRASHLLRDELIPQLAQREGIDILTPAALEEEARQWVRHFFHRRVYPLLTPLAVDPGHPFPFISSYSLNLLVELRAETAHGAWSAPSYARIKVPRLLPRFIYVPPVDSTSAQTQGVRRSFLQSEELLRYFLPDLFPGLTVQYAYLFRIVRVAEPRHVKTDALQRRSRQKELSLPVVRLDVEGAMPDDLFEWLLDHLDVPAYSCYRMSDQIGELQLVELANILDGIDAGVAANPWANVALVS